MTVQLSAETIEEFSWCLREGLNAKQKSIFP